MLRFVGVLLLLFLSLPFPNSSAQESSRSRESIVIRVIQLDYADAEELSGVLDPFLSKEGRIIAYRPTNSLIIKDRESIVNNLLKIIKGNLEQGD